MADVPTNPDMKLNKYSPMSKPQNIAPSVYQPTTYTYGSQRKGASGFTYQYGMGRKGQLTQFIQPDWDDYGVQAPGDLPALNLFDDEDFLSAPKEPPPPEKYNIAQEAAYLGIGLVKGLSNYIFDLSDWLGLQGQKAYSYFDDYIGYAGGKYDTKEEEELIKKYEPLLKDLKPWQIGKITALQAKMNNEIRELRTRDTVRLIQDAYADTGESTKVLAGFRDAMRSAGSSVDAFFAKRQEALGVSAAAEFLGDLVESTPYTAASALRYGIGFVMNFGTQQMRSAREKLAQLEASGKPLTLDRMDAIMTYSTGAALIEAGSEQIFKIGAMSGIGKAGARALSKGLLKQPAKTAIQHMIAWLVKNGMEEGIEEVISGFGQGVLAKLTTDPDATLMGIGEESGALITLEGLGKQALGGVIMGIGFSGLNSRSEYRNFKQSKIVYEEIKDMPIEDITQKIQEKGVEAFRRDILIQSNANAVRDVTKKEVMKTASLQTIGDLIDQESFKLQELQKNISKAGSEIEAEHLQKEMEQTEDRINRLRQEKRASDAVGSKWTIEQLQIKLSDKEAGLKDLQKLYNEEKNEDVKESVRGYIDQAREDIDRYKELIKAIQTGVRPEPRDVTPMSEGSEPVAEAIPLGSPSQATQQAPVANAPATKPVAATGGTPAVIPLQAPETPVAPIQTQGNIPTTERGQTQPTQATRTTTPAKKTQPRATAKEPVKKKTAPIKKVETKPAEKKKVAPAKAETKPMPAKAKPASVKPKPTTVKKAEPVKKTTAVKKTTPVKAKPKTQSRSSKIDKFMNWKSETDSVKAKENIKYTHVKNRTNLTTQQKAIKDFFEFNTGLKVEFFTHDGDSKAHQQVLSGTDFKDTIFISTSINSNYAIGHELVRVMKQEGIQKPFYDAVRISLAKSGLKMSSIQEMKDTYRRLSGATQAQADQIGKNKDLLMQEIFSIRAGHLLNTEEFWNEFANRIQEADDVDIKQESKLIKIIDNIIDWLMGIKRSVPAMQSEIDAILNAIENLKDIQLEKDIRGIKKAENIKPEPKVKGKQKVDANIPQSNIKPPVVKEANTPYASAEKEGLPDNLGMAFIDSGDKLENYINDDGTYNKRALVKLEANIKSKIASSDDPDITTLLGGKRQIVRDLINRLLKESDYKPAIIKKTVRAKRTINETVFDIKMKDYVVNEQFVQGMLDEENSRIMQTHGIDLGIRRVSNYELTEDQEAIVNLVRRISGRTVVFFSHEQKQLTEKTVVMLGGFVTSANYDYIFMNVNKAEKYSVIGHELYHTMQRNGLSDDFKDAVFNYYGMNSFADIESEYVKNKNYSKTYMDNWRKSFSSKENYESQVVEEFIAERAGELFKTKEFWQELENRFSNKNKSIIVKIYEWLKRIIEDIPTTKQEIDAYLNALEQLKVIQISRERIYSDIQNEMEITHEYGHTLNPKGYALTDYSFTVEPNQKYEGATLDHTREGIESNRSLLSADKSWQAKLQDLKEFMTLTFGRGSIEQLKQSKYGEVRRRIQQMLEINNITSTLAKSGMSSFYNQFTPAEYKLFTDMVFVLDIIEDYSNGKYRADTQGNVPGFPKGDDGTPIYNNIGEVFRHWIEIQEYMKSPLYNDGKAVGDVKDSKLMRLKLERKYMLDALRQGMAEAARQVGYDPSIFFTHREYLMHIVRDFNIVGEKSKASAHSTQLGKYFMRGDSDLGYVTDVALSDQLIMMKLLQDKMKFDLLGAVRKHDISMGDPRAKVPEGYVRVTNDALGFKVPQEDVVAGAHETIKSLAKAIDMPPWIVDAVQNSPILNNMIIPRELYEAVRDTLTKKQPTKLGMAVRKGYHAYKMVLIKFPTHAMGYQLRNATGDLDGLLASYPQALKYVKQASSELYGFYKNGDVTLNERNGKQVNDLFNYIWQGGLSTGMTHIEMEDFRKFSEFKFYERGKVTNLDKMQNAFKTLNTSYEYAIEFREQLLRYATYLYMVNEGLNNENALPAFYGASIPGEIQSIDTIEGRAYKLSNDALGAYNDVSSFTNWLSHFMPFVRWREVNIKRYYRVWKNIFYNDPAVVAGYGSQLAEKMGMAGKVGTFTLYKLGRVALGSALFTIAVQMFNKLVMPEEEEKLPQYVKDEMHLNLGIWGDKMYYFTGLGALADVGDFLSLDTFGQDIRDIKNGRMTIGEKVLEIGKHATVDLITDLNPIASALQSLVSGRKQFPEGAEVRDPIDTIFATIGFSKEYRLLTSHPDRGLGDYAFNLSGFKRQAVNEQEYWNAINLKYEYLESLGEGSFGSSGKKALAAYYYKMAIRMNDDKAALKYLTDYIIAGGKRSTLKQSLDTLDVYHGVNKRDFNNWLTEDELQTVKNGMEYMRWLKDESLDYAGDYWREAEDRSGK